MRNRRGAGGPLASVQVARTTLLSGGAVGDRRQPAIGTSDSAYLAFLKKSLGPRILKMHPTTNGDKSKFAIQWQVENKIQHWRYGRLLLWIGGKSFGDWERDDVVLHGCASNSSEESESGRNLKNEIVFGYTCQEIYEKIIYPLYEQSGISWEELIPAGRLYRKYIITDLFPINAIQILVVENSNAQRCIWMDYKTKDMGDVILPDHYVQKTLGEFARSFKAANG